MVAAVATAWLLLWAAACAQSEQDFYDFKAVNIRGKLVSLEKYRGSRLLGRSPPGTSGST
uniref:Glutathione peroxidase 7 n=1 Tax=Mus musculus TaxID=10090 RepID=V9GXV4_MOUSE